MFNPDQFLTPQEKRYRLEDSIKKVVQQGLRLRQINKDVWGGFREALLKKTPPRQREALIAYWNLY